MKPCHWSVLLVLLSLCTACRESKAKNTADTPADTITAFILPSIPPGLHTPESRADYLARHYWEHTDFADTNYLHHRELIEQAWVDYIDLLRMIPDTVAETVIRDVFVRAGKERKCCLLLAEMADKYLDTPDSPMHNEELYIRVLDALIASPAPEEIEKTRFKARLQSALRNRPGTQALDFTYKTSSGRQSTLHALESPYTLLFINNPGCPACTEAIETIKSSTVINRAIGTKQLTVLSVYPGDERNEWERHLPDYPAQWINSYDPTQTIDDKGLYDLRVMPTLYLLDKTKKVLLKDVRTEDIEAYLHTIIR